ncbi:enoyl-CoA hydratase/isomerase family protein [Actinoplanes sp. L3-i22]|uniref:enoyl-CoA hydratase/isomerase family protein n=1 Tax=Actinoplanes sp. L3-i22 TaxID=2836373 RepID=UPI001C79167B|nr:enoyl-CoA hydratase/isomerase family protein [Actinoplanes sp. L3-i22]BCY09216.1 enoyl-CoA hydratase [Actinoplanes sp. L3-i22]
MSFLEDFTPTHLKLTVESPTFWRVSFDNPPVNVIGPPLISDLKTLLTELEGNDTVNVVLFDSADPDFFLAHWDLAADPAQAEALPSPTGYAAWADVTVRLSKLAAVTISAIRGIARGAGSEFALATDMRFASLEKAVLGQMEVGFAAVAGGGAGGRLPALVGRGRAFEILLGGTDYDGATAEKYGYVNRAIPDEAFEAFVTAYATRVAGWNHQALAEIKSFVNKYTRLPDAEFPLHSDAFWSAAANRPEFRTTATRLFDKGLQQRAALEYHLGEDIAGIAQS